STFGSASRPSQITSSASRTWRAWPGVKAAKCGVWFGSSSVDTSASSPSTSRASIASGSILATTVTACASDTQLHNSKNRPNRTPTSQSFSCARCCAGAGSLSLAPLITGAFMSAPLVSLTDVSLRLGKNEVLQHINLQLHRQRITTLIGPNGAGKTCLAKLVLGLHRPSSGTLVRTPGLKIGYMPQRLRIDDSLPLTVDRFLWLADPVHRDERRAALERVGVAALQHEPVQQLSG